MPDGRPRLGVGSSACRESGKSEASLKRSEPLSILPERDRAGSLILGPSTVRPPAFRFRRPIVRERMRRAAVPRPRFAGSCAASPVARDGPSEVDGASSLSPPGRPASGRRDPAGPIRSDPIGRHRGPRAVSSLVADVAAWLDLPFAGSSLSGRLDRMESTSPLTALDRMLDPLSDCLNDEVARRIVASASPRSRRESRNSPASAMRASSPRPSARVRRLRRGCRDRQLDQVEGAAVPDGPGRQLMDEVTRGLVRDRAGNRCEYCLHPQEHSETTHHVDHIVARQHLGSDARSTSPWLVSTAIHIKVRILRASIPTAARSSSCSILAEIAGPIISPSAALSSSGSRPPDGRPSTSWR